MLKFLLLEVFLVLYWQLRLAARVLPYNNEVQFVPYLYEVQRDTDPANAAAGLFSSLQLVYTESVVAGWDRLPQFGTAESRIFYPLEPSLYHTDSQHDVAATSQRLGYTKKDVRSIDEYFIIR